VRGQRVNPRWDYDAALLLGVEVEAVALLEGRVRWSIRPALGPQPGTRDGRKT